MKQSKISFSNSKRSSSGSTFSSSKKRQRQAASIRRTVSEIEVISSDDDQAEKQDRAEEESLKKRAKRGSDTRIIFSSRDGRENSRLSSLDDDNDEQEDAVNDSVPRSKSGRLQASKYSRYLKDVRKKMGNMSAIHAEGQTKIHQMLRVFDLSYEYGPCSGISRHARWRRAEAMGLNPPPEVLDILLSQEGMERADYREEIYHNLI